MSISNINKKIIHLGDGLMARIKYEFGWSYSPYEFLKLRHEKDQALETKVHKSLYKIK